MSKTLWALSAQARRDRACSRSLSIKRSAMMKIVETVALEAAETARAKLREDLNPAIAKALLIFSAVCFIGGVLLGRLVL